MPQGYPTKPYSVPVKRYCRTMDLKPDDILIHEYIRRHSEGEVWTEILAGIREVGILEMEIYLLGNRLFMIVDTPGPSRHSTSPAGVGRLYVYLSGLQRG